MLYCCEFCGAKFKRESEVLEHERRHQPAEDKRTARVVIHDLPRERLVIEPEEDFIIIRREVRRRGEWRDTEEEAVYVHADAVRELGQALIQVASRQVYA